MEKLKEELLNKEKEKTKALEILDKLNEDIFKVHKILDKLDLDINKLKERIAAK